MERVETIWSNSTLEETVYALLHNGEYPVNNRQNIYFWKNNSEIDLPDEKTIYKLCKLPNSLDEEFICKFDDIPIRDFYEWLCSNFLEWREKDKIDEAHLQSGSFNMKFICGIRRSGKSKLLEAFIDVILKKEPEAKRISISTSEIYLIL